MSEITQVDIGWTCWLQCVTQTLPDLTKYEECKELCQSFAVPLSGKAQPQKSAELVMQGVSADHEIASVAAGQKTPEAVGRCR
jgi:hypothetical protein